MSDRASASEAVESISGTINFVRDAFYRAASKRLWEQASYIGEALLRLSKQHMKPKDYLLLSRAYLNLGDNRQALLVCIEGKSKHPLFEPLFVHELRARKSIYSDEDSAEFALRSLSKFGPECTIVTLNAVAEVLLRAGRFDEARGILQRASSLDACHVPTIENLLTLAHHEGRWEDCLLEWQSLQVLTEPPGKLKIREQAARAFLETGRARDGEAVLAARDEREKRKVLKLLTWIEIQTQTSDAMVAYSHAPLLSWNHSQRQRLSRRLPMRDFGSMTEGNADWDRKWWGTPKERRILMLAPKDFSGSMFKLAEAINRHSAYRARLVTFHPHPFGYPDDIVLPELDPERKRRFYRLLDSCALVHLKDEQTWFSERECINRELLNELVIERIHDVAIVFTAYGGWSRALRGNPDWLKVVEGFDARVAFTPDLILSDAGWSLVPHAIDTDTLRSQWRDGTLLGHASSTVKPTRKGTDLLFQAIRNLEIQENSAWTNWQVDFFCGIPHKRAMERKANHTVYFDQAGHEPMHGPLGVSDIIGWYGNAAIESMALGVPTIAHLSSSALQLAAQKMSEMRDHAVINVKPNPESIASALDSFVTAKPYERREISQFARQFTERVHGFAAVASQLSQVYEGVMGE